MPERNIIEAIELTKVYQDFWGRARVRALDRFNFEVRPGEVYGLLGPNGSGKTTTVRLLLGLLFPTKGLVRLFGKSPRRVDVKKLIGYMPEESHLYEYLTAEETLHFFGRLFGLPRSERRRRVDALIGMVGLGRARRRAIGEFSKGMARRIGLAQALINDPDLLILDEPTTGLDPIGSREMKDVIQTLKGRGKTVLLCSHLLADVEEICDRICILYGGRARSSGNVSELLTEQDTMQIRAPRFSESGLEKLRALVREEAGPEATMEIGSPTRRLEDYFLGVVAEARRERVLTSGAEAGGPAAEFLSGEPEGAELVEELVEAARVSETPREVPDKTEPAAHAVAGATQDRELLEGLADVPLGERPKREPDQQVEAAAPGETDVHRDVFEGLLQRTEQPEQEGGQEEGEPDTE